MIITNGSYSVYAHINKINGKMYIGITKKQNLNNRWHNGNGYNYNPHFWSAIQKYGWDNFEHEIIASHLNSDEASNMEKFLISKLQTTNEKYGYNIASGGEKCRGLSGERNPFYRKVPVAAIAASVAKRTGKKLSDEHKRKIAEGCKGKIFTKEHIKKYADAQRNVPRARRGDCKNANRIMCVETGIIYNCQLDVADMLGVSRSAVTNAMKRGQACGGYHWIKVVNSND